MDELLSNAEWRTLTHHEQYHRKQYEFSRINSRIVQRFFRRRQAASSLLRKTIVRASDYGIEVLDLSNMSLPAYQLGLTSFDEPVMYTFFDSYEARKQTYIDFGWPLILKPLEETLAKFAFFIRRNQQFYIAITAALV